MSTALVCPRCLTARVEENPPQLGQPIKGDCRENCPFVYQLLKLPPGYVIAREDAA
jgi:hypothetical protein